MIDQFQRQISYLRISLTDRCNLRCNYCMPPEGIEKKTHEEMLRLEEHLNIVKALAPLGIRKVRLTGGEPLIVKGVEELVRQIKQVDGIEEVVMTTNGILLKEKLAALHEAGLDRVNISLDTLDPKVFEWITRGGKLAPVLEAMEEAIRLGMNPVKVNTVLIKGTNDHEIMDLIEKLPKGVEIRFIELMPIGEAAKFSKERFMNVYEAITSIPGMIEDTSKKTLGPCRYYTHEPTGRTVGIINPISHDFCATCNRLRITADGKLKTCLHSDKEVDLKPFVHDEKQIQEVILEALRHKPKQHHLNEGEYIHRNMNTIGG